MSEVKLLSAEEVIRALCELWGVTEYGLAKRLHLKQQSVITKWKDPGRGGMVPMDALAKIADKSGLSLDWLRYGEGAPYRGREPAPDALAHARLVEKIRQLVEEELHERASPKEE
jgi:hypothetical protein